MSKEVTILEKKVSPMVTQAENIAINSAKDMDKAATLLSDLNKVADKIEAEKQKVLTPLNQAAKAERARWKPLETMYENGIAALRRAMSNYQTQQKAIADAEASKIAARVGEGKGKLKAETAIAKIGDIERPDAVLSSDSGTVKFRTKKNFEIVDATLLPREFLIPNEDAIKEAMKKNEPVPGVRYFETQEPVNFR